MRQKKKKKKNISSTNSYTQNFTSEKTPNNINNQNLISDETSHVLESTMELFLTSSTNQNVLVISNKTPIFFDFEIGLPFTSPTEIQNLILEKSQSNPSDIVSIFSKHLIEMQATNTRPKSTKVIPRLNS